mmetsp:Transcript_13006/g.46194  ORF Transcript_13006/g.46194 Transcript_13006/m.46194 type:complete len:208 (+) Transcript_13006:252-875(+)
MAEARQRRPSRPACRQIAGCAPARLRDSECRLSVRRRVRARHASGRPMRGCDPPKRPAEVGEASIVTTPLEPCPTDLVSHPRASGLLSPSSPSSRPSRPDCPASSPGSPGCPGQSPGRRWPRPPPRRGAPWRGERRASRGPSRGLRLGCWTSEPIPRRQICPACSPSCSRSHKQGGPRMSRKASSTSLRTIRRSSWSSPAATRRSRP